LVPNQVLYQAEPLPGASAAAVGWRSREDHRADVRRRIY
jgi:hypothetical protein